MIAAVFLNLLGICTFGMIFPHTLFSSVVGQVDNRSYFMLIAFFSFETSNELVRRMGSFEDKLVTKLVGSCYSRHLELTSICVNNSNWLRPSRARSCSYPFTNNQSFLSLSSFLSSSTSSSIYYYY